MSRLWEFFIIKPNAHTYESTTSESWFRNFYTHIQVFKRINYIHSTRFFHDQHDNISDENFYGFLQSDITLLFPIRVDLWSCIWKHVCLQDSPLSSKVALFNAVANKHLQNQSVNPFSQSNVVGTKPKISKEEYGRWVKYTKESLNFLGIFGCILQIISKFLADWN